MKTMRNELKLRADKCPIKRFKAFIGKANTQATLCADTGIEIIGWSGFDASDLNAKSHRVDLARFIAAADPETILALLAELEAKDKRILELDYLRLSACEVFKEIGNELGCNPDNESIMMAIDELKKRLATPVRLPEKDDLRLAGDASTKVVIKFRNSAIDECDKAIRAAGFTVEGDE
ncbi:ead/Ea22-like family protein [Serratia sarumanii]|uniref:ead/Ea22-like family protein n=1 Tax=Serratia sarumanii TaxID=3020826 RepID=UPI003F6D45E9